MEHEKDRAKENNPIHATKSLTDTSYHLALDRLMEEVREESASIMVATHNKETVRRALGLIKKHGLSLGDRICFGQLLGMGDHLTYPLATAGYNANKVVPYGGMEDLMPFLSRRGNENRGMIENSREERLLYFEELNRRVFSRRVF